MLTLPRRHLLPIALAVALVALGATTAAAAPVVTSGAGDDVAALRSVVDGFRGQLGTLNTGPAATAGRREISWDDVPDTLATPAGLPFDSFNTTTPRGLLLTAADGSAASAEVSADADNADGTEVRFGNLNSTYDTTFATFSPERLLNAASRPLDVVFRVPGSRAGATTSGFGAVFTSVSIANSTFLQFFDAAGRDLGSYFAPVGRLSFVGVRFDAGERVALVRVGQGNAALGRRVDDDGATDVVAIDDVVYGEPQALAASGESFENGLGPFTPSRSAGRPDDSGWIASSLDQHAGANSAHAPDPAYVTDVSLTSAPVAISASPPPRLTFFHRIASDAGSDGGRVEISTDGGASWSAPPATQYLQYPPNERIGGSTGALAGELAWTGSSIGFQRSVLDLAPYAGQTIRYRFRFATDARIAGRGWFVDDVTVAAAVPGPAPPSEPGAPPGGSPGGPPPGTTPGGRAPEPPSDIPEDLFPSDFFNIPLDLLNLPPGVRRPPSQQQEQQGPDGSGRAAARITALSLNPRAFRARRGGTRGRAGGTTLRFRLSAPARVRFAVAGRATGRRVGGRCRIGARSGRRCTRYAPIGTFAVNGSAGANTASFSGRVRGRALSPGRYRLTGSVGSSSRSTGFTVLRAKRR